MPSRSAIMCGTTCTRPSVDSAPHSTRSADSPAIAAASTFDVASAHEPCRAPSVTWTAPSGPIDSALRIESAARSGPMVRITTSPPCASRSRSASSMAYSSISLITLLADPRSTVLSSGRRLRSAPESGTCLTSTTIFIELPLERAFVCAAYVTGRPARLLRKAGVRLMLPASRFGLPAGVSRFTRYWSGASSPAARLPVLPRQRAHLPGLAAYRTRPRRRRARGRAVPQSRRGAHRPRGDPAQPRRAGRGVVGGALGAHRTGHPHRWGTAALAAADRPRGTGRGGGGGARRDRPRRGTRPMTGRGTRPVTDPGRAPERTRLSWWRTALAATVVTLLAARLALRA